ncbi:hypothetical protein B0T14DRAFT_77061 [Immersiella caudata]|uniref:Uncharacterized protein n=1 Tax=Immersiella caudata TaxID=314043 RepID=A0AA39XGP0_9PEZI|nr:hypothetical protein B0T14DRAFT_77061 [Immersiella caudata]
MGGRGRGRPTGRASADPATVAGRRSTRGQQQQQQQQQQLQAKQQDGEQQQQDPQIDPAITDAQTGGMPPPPVPARGRSREGPRLPRRGALVSHNHRGSSVTSINSIPESSYLVDEPHDQRVPATPAPLDLPFLPPSSALSETPSHANARNKLMKSFLPRLKEDSEKLATHLLRSSSDRDEETWEPVKKYLYNYLCTTRDIYTAEPGNAILDINYILQRIGVQRDDPLFSITTQIVSMANIAHLLNEMTVADPSTFLQVADSHFLGNCIPEFPEKCITKNNNGNAILSSERIVQVVMDIRTQLLLSELESYKVSNQDHDPLQLLAAVFLPDGATMEQLAEMARNSQELGDSEDSQRLLFREIPGVNTTPGSWEWESLRLRYQSLYTNLTELKQLIGDQWQAKWSMLRDLFAYTDFEVDFRQCLGDAFNETKLLLDGDSRTSQASDARIDSQVQSQLEAEVRRGEGTPYSAFQAVASLEQHRLAAGGGLSNQDILSHPIHSSAYHPASSVPYPNFSAYSDPPVQPNGALYAQSAAQATAGGRKRRAPSGGEAASAPAKKPRGRRKQDVAPPSSSMPPSAQSGISAGESQYPPLPSSAAFGDTDFEAVSQRSREISAANRKAREPQVRSAWVRNDIKQLVKAVDVYKCKWSTIEKEIKAGTIVFEIPRDQQALRDKARLLKQDFLK